MRLLAPCASVALLAVTCSMVSADPNALPIGEQVTESEAIAQALVMPAVQLAMSDYSARGYIRKPEGDRMVKADTATAVMLQYYNESDDMGFQPVICAVSADGPTSVLRTGVVAWTYKVTEEDIAVSDDGPQYEVHINDMGSSAPDNYHILPSTKPKTFRDCLGYVLVQCAIHCLFTGPPFVVPCTYFCWGAGLLICAIAFL